MNWILVSKSQLPPIVEKPKEGERPQLVFGISNPCLGGALEYRIGWFDGIYFISSGTTAGWMRVKEYYLL